MTKRWSRIVAFALFCLLAFTASASAECAWVLWEEQENTISEPFETTWKTPLAYPSRAACVAVIEEYVRHWEKNHSPEQSVSRAASSTSAEFATRTRELGRELIVRRHCLPDTVDPRGPKGR